MNSLLILVAPPASGKTFWIEQFHQELREKILFISPLRALADECREKWGDKIEVKTPEEWLLNPSFRRVVIFDEYHLYFYWGNSFRPLMWEVFYALANEAELVVFLTATLSCELQKETTFLSQFFDQVIWCDQGNQKLKYTPFSYLKAPSMNWIEDLILLGPRGEYVNLIFCKYREDVFEMQKKIQSAGFDAWGFVGGQANQVAIKLANNKLPQFIVATTVLSHGVNLPKISCVYFCYQLKNKDFWIQMIARGGRKKEKFEVIALEKPIDLKWNWLINFGNVILLHISKMIRKELRELKKWWLKEL